jgi:ENTS family enterobactin (siderophore) exporter
MAVVLAGLAGFGSAPGDVMMTSLIQRLTPPHMLGKVFSFWSTLAFVGDSGSGLLTGLLMAQFSPVAVFVGASMTALAVGVFGLVQVLRGAAPPSFVRRPTHPSLTSGGLT